MKRIVLGLAALAAVAATAAPASAHAYVKYCYATARYPCGICVEEASLYTCVP